MIVMVVPVVVVVPARFARKFKVAPGVTCRIAVAAEALDGAIEVPFGVLDTFVAAAPAPRLGLSRRGTAQ